MSVTGVNIIFFFLIFSGLYLMLFFGVERVADKNSRITGLVPFFVCLSFYLSGTFLILLNDFRSFEPLDSSISARAPPKGGAEQKVKIPNFNSEKKASQKSFDLKSWNSFGLLILSISFLFFYLRKPDQTSFLIEAIAAWNKLDLNNTKEVLVKHGLENKDDRDWVLKVLKIENNFKDDVQGSTQQNDGSRQFEQTEEH